jgi:hypothetical protein
LAILQSISSAIWYLYRHALPFSIWFLSPQGWLFTQIKREQKVQKKIIGYHLYMFHHPGPRLLYVDRTDEMAIDLRNKKIFASIYIHYVFKHVLAGMDNDLCIVLYYDPCWSFIK